MSDAEIVPFWSRTPDENYRRMVDAARRSHAFGTDLDFDATGWPVGAGGTRRSGGSASTTTTLWFTASSMKGRNAAFVAEPMLEPFAGFIKAYVRLYEAASPQLNMSGHGNAIRAGRYLYAALADKARDPCLLEPEDFRRAAELARRDVAEGTVPYRIGVYLARIAKFVSDRGIAGRRIDFANPFAHEDQKTRISPEAEAARDTKLPSEAALAALGSIPTADLSNRDLLLLRVVQLLACAPWRIGELLTLPVDPEVYEAATHNGIPALDADGQPVMRYGIRYLGSKGWSWDVKWIPTTMTDVAKRAIRDITRITASARAVARYMHDNPGRAWLPLPYGGGPPDRLLTPPEIADLTGVRNDHLGRNAREIIYDNGIPVQQLPGRRIACRQDDFEAFLLSRSETLPEGHPLARHECLMLVHRNFFHSLKGEQRSVVEFVDYPAVQEFLCGRGGSGSIFERHGLAMPDGSPIRMNTHQLRHFLNTIGQRGGISQLEMAMWSGRKHVAQNAVYDHLSGYELAEKARTMIETDRMRGPIRIAFDRHPPVERSAFLQVHLSTAHTTDLGMCLHDWAAAPCPHHGACAAGCTDCAVVKGDPVGRERARQRLAEAEIMLDKARAEAGDGTYGAANFVAYHERLVAGLRAIMAIHDDASIPDGTIVQLPALPVPEEPIRRAG